MAALVEAEWQKTAVPAVAYGTMKTGAGDRFSNPIVAIRAGAVDARCRRFFTVNLEQLAMQVV